MLSLAVFLLLTSRIEAIPIDNGVEGEPEIECSSDSISITFNTRNEFQGHVYVKGRFDEDGCRSDEKGRRVTGIKLGFSNCGTRRNRSLNPKGVFVTTTLVISFHPHFLTKVDRAYTIQCFYMEADKTVSQDIQVSEITTAFHTQIVPMPICRYEILDGTSTGPPVKFATIGQQVYHKWTCDTETADIFCAVIHSCFVDDAAGNRAQLLDEQGCALDKHLLNNLEYQSDLMAGQEAHVFKYADKPALVFQCQITILIKEPGEPCVRPQCLDPGTLDRSVSSAGSSRPRSSSADIPVTGVLSLNANTAANSSDAALFQPPAAPLANNETRRRDARPVRKDFSALAARLLRRIRSLDFQPDTDQAETLGTWDVTSQRITALDIDDTGDTASVRRQDSISGIQGRIEVEQKKSPSYCMSSVSLGFVITTAATGFLSGLTAIIVLCLKTRQSEKRKINA